MMQKKLFISCLLLSLSSTNSLHTITTGNHRTYTLAPYNVSCSA